jgi:hypothetical protein
MCLKILIFHKSLALITLCCFNSTNFYVLNPSFNLEHLVTILACFWPHLTSFFMRTEYRFSSWKLTMLTFNFYVCFYLVLFLIRFGYNLPTFLTFIIDFRALHFMHSELACFNLFFAIFAQLRFLFYHN